MAFTAEDAIHLLTKSDKVDARSSERFSSEVSSVSFMSPAQIKGIFPDVEFAASDNVVYAPVSMCHSLPKINKRGRTFTANTLSRSHPSARDQLVDIDHEVAANSGLLGRAAKNNICGHIKCTHFGWKNSVSTSNEASKISEAADNFSVPEVPIPLHALLALYLRHNQVEDIVKKHVAGKESWFVSMECGHCWKESDLFHRGEFIPFMDAPGPMLEGIKTSSIDRYDGHEVAAVLGGRDGIVDFWGLGLTRQPADDEGDIHSMFTGTSFEVANSKRKIFFPISGDVHKGKFAEVASITDKKFDELASIVVIGKTEEAAGHIHEILSDGTILPSGDYSHVHYLSTFNIERGSNPKFTAVTDNRFDSVKVDVDQWSESVHSHYVNISLKGKKVQSDVDVDLNSLDYNLKGECEVTLNDFLKRLDDITTKFGGEQKEGLASEVASLKEEVSKFKAEDELKETVSKEIADKIESGELVSKEDYDKAIEDAVKVALTEEKVKHDKEARKANRIKTLEDLKIDLDYKYNPKEDLTVRLHVESMPLDEDGDKEFERNLVSLKQMVDLAKRDNEEEQEQERLKEEEKVAASASKANNPNSILAGAGPTKDSEAANKDTSPGKKIGKGKLTCLVS